jgi:hypothetical protein
VDVALVISYQCRAMDVPANPGEVPAKNRFLGS